MVDLKAQWYSSPWFWGGSRIHVHLRAVLEKTGTVEPQPLNNQGFSTLGPLSSIVRKGDVCFWWQYYSIKVQREENKLITSYH